MLQNGLLNRSVRKFSSFFSWTANEPPSLIVHPFKLACNGASGRKGESRGETEARKQASNKPRHNGQVAAAQPPGNWPARHHLRFDREIREIAIELELGNGQHRDGCCKPIAWAVFD